MADKYINRDKLLEAYGDCIVTYCLQPKHGTFPTYGETALWDYIETMPTADVVSMDRYINAIKTINMMSKVLEEFTPVIRRRWISVTEALPEEDTDVLICYRYKQGEGDTSHVKIDITNYGTVCFGGRAIDGLKEWRAPFEYFHSNYEVIAWMPLPEPYKMDEVEE